MGGIRQSLNRKRAEKIGRLDLMYRLKSSNKKQKGVVRRLRRLCIKDVKRTSELIR